MEVLCYVLYSSLDDKKGQKELKEWLAAFSELYGVEVISLDGKGDIGGILRWFDPNARILILGDDETVSKIMNAARSIRILNEVMYYPVGKNRSFYLKVAGGDYDVAVDISDYVDEEYLCRGRGESPGEGSQMDALFGGEENV